MGLQLMISIHTPTKGATVPDPKILLVHFYFNPHSHKGSDFIRILLSCSVLISIHTPTKGATMHQDLLFDVVRKFQSTLPQRERPIRAVFCLSFNRFQSTLPQRERHSSVVCSVFTVIISIHTPTKGATSRV